MSKKITETKISLSPIDFGSTSAIRSDISPDQTEMISRDISILNYNSNNQVNAV